MTDEAQRHTPDYFLQNFTATTMNKQGQPAYKVTSVHMDHFPDDDSMKLQQPVFTFYENNIQTWSAQATEAIILQDEKKIHLNGDVILQQLDKREATPLLITAEQLTVEPEKQRASSKSKIKLIKGDNTIQATGMRADMNKNRIEFLSNTRSHYVLPTK
jgi:lipopolysaccharide export system protein LptC